MIAGKSMKPADIRPIPTRTYATIFFWKGATFAPTYTNAAPITACEMNSIKSLDTNEFGFIPDIPIVMLFSSDTKNHASQAVKNAPGRKAIQRKITIT